MGEDKTAFIGKPAKEHTYSTYKRTYIHTHTRTALPHLYKTKLHLCVCIFFIHVIILVFFLYMLYSIELWLFFLTKIKVVQGGFSEFVCFSSSSSVDNEN